LRAVIFADPAEGRRNSYEYAHMKLANLNAAIGNFAESAFALGTGFQHPLAPAVAAPLPEEEPPAEAAAKAGRVSVFGGALSSGLLGVLRAVFRQESTFWKAHSCSPIPAVMPV